MRSRKGSIFFGFQNQSTGIPGLARSIRGAAVTVATEWVIKIYDFHFPTPRAAPRLGVARPGYSQFCNLIASSKQVTWRGVFRKLLPLVDSGGAGWWDGTRRGASRNHPAVTRVCWARVGRALGVFPRF